jgi:hypothetical protein
MMRLTFSSKFLHEAMANHRENKRTSPLFHDGLKGCGRDKVGLQ